MKRKFTDQKLIERGSIFMRYFIILIGLIFVNAFLLDSFNLRLFENQFSSSLFIVMLIVVAINLELIFRNLYDPDFGSALPPMASGIFSAVFILIIIISAVTHPMVIWNGYLTEDAADLFLYTCLVVIFGTHWLKGINNKNRPK
jgi:hypothetical protein